MRACNACRAAALNSRGAWRVSESRLLAVRGCSRLRHTFTLDSSLGFSRSAQLHSEAGAVPCIHLRVHAAESSSACGGRHATLLRGEPAVSTSDGADPGTPRSHPPPGRNPAEHRAAGSAGGFAGPTLKRDGPWIARAARSAMTSVGQIRRSRRPGVRRPGVVIVGVVVIIHPWSIRQLVQTRPHSRAHRFRNRSMDTAAAPKGHRAHRAPRRSRSRPNERPNRRGRVSLACWSWSSRERARWRGTGRDRPVERGHLSEKRRLIDTLRQELRQHPDQLARLSTQLADAQADAATARGQRDAPATQPAPPRGARCHGHTCRPGRAHEPAAGRDPRSGPRPQRRAITAAAHPGDDARGP